MGFLVGYILGFALGIALIVGFARYHNVRSKRRIDLAAAIAAFARMTIQDSKKILPDPFYPSWVVFSQQQKLKWLNQHLDKLWPYVDEAASELIRNSVEPILEQYRPAILAALKFSKLTLGTVAPQFTGVSMLESEPGEVIMELELQWDGNPNIVLDIKTRVGVALPIQKNLDFTLKVIGGDVSAIPGISDALQSTIRDAIEDCITWPVRNIVPILPGDYSYLELKPAGSLEVKLIQAKELTNKDIIGKSDPFVELFIRPIRAKTKTSKTINNQINPVWNEHFEFVVEDVSTQHLTIRVSDDEGIQAAELIGCAQMPLCDLVPGKVKDVWLKLVKNLDIQRDTKNRGQVHLELLYCPFGTDCVFMNPFNPDFGLTSMEKALLSGTSGGVDSARLAKSATPTKKDFVIRGVLSVTVISAESLPSTDLMGKSDPFVVLLMKKSEQKNKTRVLNSTLNPVWNQTFDFIVEDGLHELLMLEVYDHDTFGKDKMGRCIMTLTRVILEEDVTESFFIDGTPSGKLNLHLKWAAQPIIRD